MGTASDANHKQLLFAAESMAIVLAAHLLRFNATRQQILRAYTIEQLSGVTGLAPNTINKILYRHSSVDRSTLDRCFSSFGSILDSDDYQYSPVAAHDLSICPIERQPAVKTQSLDWGEAPDVSIFYGVFLID